MDEASTARVTCLVVASLSLFDLVEYVRQCKYVSDLIVDFRQPTSGARGSTGWRSKTNRVEMEVYTSRKRYENIRTSRTSPAKEDE